MLRKVSVLLFFVLLNSAVFGGNFQAGKSLSRGNVHYLPGRVVVKIKTSPGLNKSSAISSLSKKLSAYSIKDISNTFLDKSGALGDIVTIEYSTPLDPMEMAEVVKRTGNVQWAEPHFVYKTNYVPNDPSYNQQWNLSKIQAELAWDITKGDTSVVIGIVDTGVEWGHPDLKDKIWINKKEVPGNGVDDDNNGYIDDVRGWDFGGLNGKADNNPDEDRADHGSHVAGIAAASTGNGTGISSIGINCKIMAVKTSRDDDRDQNGNVYVDFGYEGIIYAADNGAKIINCSWGGDGFSKAGQEVINYAISKGVLVVTSAGNENTGEPSYPAAFDGVLSVGSTDDSDARSYYSNYGTWVDVMAPGRRIYSTWKHNTYEYLSGTSMASPLAAGLAGLVASRFPSFTPLQIAEQIRVNCDNVDAQNPDYIYQLGGGRINAYKALNNVNSKSVRGSNFVFSDKEGNNNGVFEPGETITLSADFMNYLSPVSALDITLQSVDGYASVSKPQFSAGAVQTLGSFNNSSNKFSFIINSNVPNNYQLKFLIKYSDAGYADNQLITVKVNPSYLTQAAGKVDLTITSKGALGFNDYPINKEGTGFRYNGGPNLLFEGALMYGTSAEKLSDAARYGEMQQSDFNVLKSITFAKKEDGWQGSLQFNDENAGSSSLGIETTLKSYSYLQSPNDKLIILRYSMVNKSSSDITGLHAGLFLDWDINADTSGAENALYDLEKDFGYAYSQLSTPGIMAGCALVSAGKYGYYAIRNDGSDGGVGLYSQSQNEFTKDEKWLTLSNGITKREAGTGDISMVVSGGPYDIKAMDTLEVAFAIFAGGSIAELRNTVQIARNKYQAIINPSDSGNVAVPIEYSLSQNYPNPFNSASRIDFAIPEASQVTLKVYDMLGREAATIINGRMEKGKHTVEIKPEGLSSGIYIYTLKAGSYTSSKKMVILK